MSETELLKNPTNRIVAVFDTPQSAKVVIRGLTDYGVDAEEIRLAQGEESAGVIDTSPEWFADTDDEIEKYNRKMEAGHTVISVPARESEGREAIHAVLEENGARYITYFGQWVTELMR